MEPKPRLLIVEDEAAIRQGLVDVFVFHQFEVDVAEDGHSGMQKALTGDYNLVLLDVMLPKKDGFSVCSEIKKARPEIAVIMLTAKTSEEDIVTGLSLGADDYVSKPFSVRELVLRVQAVLRRTHRAEEHPIELKVGDAWTIDTQNLIGKREGGSGPVLFTRKEIEILQYLQSHQSRPVSREELLREVWGYRHAEHIETRTVDIHMAKLRRKIEQDPKNPRWLVTIRGEGYRLDSDPSSP